MFEEYANETEEIALMGRFFFFFGECQQESRAINIIIIINITVMRSISWCIVNRDVSTANAATGLFCFLIATESSFMTSGEGEGLGCSFVFVFSRNLV